MQDSQWLALTVEEATQRLQESGMTIAAIHKTVAPARQQDGSGPWRVVKVQRSPEGVTLTVAWQSTSVTLACDVQLG